MDKKSSLDLIIKDLAVEEKKDLLNKIQKPDKQSQESSDDVNEKLTPAQKRDNQLKIARKEYEKYGWLSKMIIKMISIIKGKRTEEIVLENIILNIKKEIISRYGNIVDFEKNAFTNEFVKEIIPLAKSGIELSQLFSRYIPDNINSFVAYLFENGLSEQKRKMLAQTDPENLGYNRDYFDKMKFSKEKDKRFKDYFNIIERSDYFELSSQIDKFEILQKLISFDFRSFLKLFYVLDPDDKISSSNFAEYYKIDKDLERLFRIIYNITFKFSDIDFILNYAEYVKLTADNTGKTLIPTQDEIRSIGNIFNALENLLRKLPLLMIFRFFKEDIQYTPNKINSPYNFLLNYKSFKKDQNNKIWDAYYKKMKEKYLSDLIEELLGFYEFTTLSHFSTVLKAQLEKYSTVKVGNVYYLNLTMEFINRIYKKKIEPIINSLLVNGNFKNEGSKVSLSNAYFELDNVQKNIMEYDESFSENNGQGKKLMTFIKLVGTDSKYVKTLQNKVLEINTKTLELVKSVSTPLKNMYEILLRILDQNNPVMCPVSNVDSIRFSGYLANPIKAIEDSVKYFTLYYNILENFDEGKK